MVMGIEAGVARSYPNAEALAGPGGWLKLLNDALEVLLAALSVRPAQTKAVAVATGRLREILGEYADVVSVTPRLKEYDDAKRSRGVVDGR